MERLADGSSSITVGENRMNSFTGSDIIKEASQVAIISKMFKSKDKFELIYQASKDGWGIEAFHQTCDNRGPTLTIFKSSKGNVFAGYTSVPWTSNNSGEWQTDREAFLISIDSRELVYHVDDPTKAVYHDSNWGPNFGGEDLGLNNDPMNEKEEGQC